LRTIEEVRREFKDTGVSVSEWARDRGFSVPLVYGVLRGRPAIRGQSHNIAVALGLKEGRMGSVKELEFEV
jgi:gp16 family phage-associated protein